MNNAGELKMKYAKHVTSSKQYIAFVTGSKAYLLNKQYVILQYYENLDHVYYVEISSDERYLLLGSTSNHFYLVDIVSQAINKITIQAPYNSNTEMMVRFSNDSQNIYAVCLNSKTVLSCLRVYSVHDLSDYNDYLDELYWISAIDVIIDKNQSVLLAGCDRKKDQHHLLWFENGIVRDYKMPLFYDDIVESVNYVPKEHIIIVFGQSTILFCDEYGEAYAEINATGLVYYNEDGSCNLGDSFYKCLLDVREKLEYYNERLQYSYSLFSSPIRLFPSEKTLLCICGQHGIYMYDINTRTFHRVFKGKASYQCITQLGNNDLVLTSLNRSILLKQWSATIE